MNARTMGEAPATLPKLPRLPREPRPLGLVPPSGAGAAPSMMAEVAGLSCALERQPLNAGELATLKALARQPGARSDTPGPALGAQRGELEARLVALAAARGLPVEPLPAVERLPPGTSRRPPLAERRTVVTADGITNAWTLRPEAYAALIRLGYLRWAEPFGDGAR